ncbi:DUF6961 family protein [Sphingomonas bacterium]|uniref:DUF6961 family protein n=1 Tax=Sphingomonas bacterium TaxID=1895847 RepID=UPI001575C825|nr:hypothetical protein [Sphingomonas bacterium]
MTSPQDEQQRRWAEALAFEKQWGVDAPLRIAERIGVVALLGDEQGIARLKQIAACVDQIIQAKVRNAQ